MKKRLDIFSGALIAVAFAALFIYGGGKAPLPSAPVYWDDPFNGYSYVIDTNDLRHITFGWDAPPAYIPLDARAEISAVSLRDLDTPDVFVVTNVSMFAFGADVWMAYDATNYAVYVECDCVPTPSIVASGSCHGPAVGTGERAVPIGVKIKMVNRNTGETREVR